MLNIGTSKQFQESARRTYERVACSASLKRDQCVLPGLVYSPTLLVLGGAGGPQALLTGFEGCPLAFPPLAAEGGTERI